MYRVSLRGPKPCVNGSTTIGHTRPPSPPSLVYQQGRRPGGQKTVANSSRLPRACGLAVSRPAHLAKPEKPPFLLRRTPGRLPIPGCKAVRALACGAIRFNVPIVRIPGCGPGSALT